jgi:hypothetical protein
MSKKPKAESAPELSFVMEKVGSEYQLWACRGEGRGCPRNRYRTRKVHCADCVPCHDGNETLTSIVARLQRGDA